MKKFNNKSFTLLELLVVIAVIAILAGIIMVSVSDARRKATEAKGLQFSQNIHTTLGVDLVGEWTFDDEENLCRDSSGNNNNCSLSGGSPLFVENGKTRGCVFFDGISDRIDIYTDRVSNKFSTIHGPSTLSFWFMPKRLNQLQYVISDVWPEWSVFLDNDNIINAQLYTVISTDININIERWYNVAISHDHGSDLTNTEVTVYINGEQIKDPVSYDVSGHNGYIERLRIGATYKDGSWNHFFKGFVDEVRIYSKALTAHEIKQLYAEGKNRHMASHK